VALVKAFVLGGETVDFLGLFFDNSFQSTDLCAHFIAYPGVFVFALDAALVFGEDPCGGVMPEFGTSVTPRADKTIRRFSVAGHSASGLVLCLEDFPVHFGKLFEEFFELLMATRHPADFLKHGCADVFGSGFAPFLEGKGEPASRPLRGN